MVTSPPGFEQIMASGGDIGLFSGILPFIITYTIFFFLIRRIDLLDGGDNDTFAAILAIAFAFYTSRFIIANPVYEQFILDYVSRIALITIGLLGLLVVLAFVGMDLSNNNSLGYIMALIVIVAFAVSGGVPVIAGEGALASVYSLFNWLIESGTIWVLAVLGLLGWTLRDDEENENNGGLPELFTGIGGNGE